MKISGLGIETSFLIREIQEVKDKNFILDFVYKDAPIIERDLSEANSKKATQRKLMEEFMEKAYEIGMTNDEIDQMMKDKSSELRGSNK